MSELYSNLPKLINFLNLTCVALKILKYAFIKSINFNMTLTHTQTNKQNQNNPERESLYNILTTSIE